MPKTDPRPFQIWRVPEDAKTHEARRLVFHSSHPTSEMRDKNLEKRRASGDGFEYVARDPDDRLRPDARRTL